jgi:heme exporter protein D
LIETSLQFTYWQIAPFYYGVTQLHMRVLLIHSYQSLDEVVQNIVICRARADQLFANAEGRGK